MSETIRFFHDQKSDAFFKSGASLNVTEHDAVLWSKHMHEEAAQQSVEHREALEKEVAIIADTLSKVRNARLKHEFREDPEQQALLERSKKNAEKLVRDVFDKAFKYYDFVTAHRFAKTDIRRLDGDNRQQAMDKVEVTDRQRRFAHNSLIASLHAAIRYISYTFNKLSEDVQEQWEEQQIEQGREVLEVERQALEQQILCPDSVNLQDRDQIKDWVIRLHHHFEYFAEEVKK